MSDSKGVMNPTGGERSIGVVRRSQPWIVILWAGSWTGATSNGLGNRFGGMAAPRVSTG